MRSAFINGTGSYLPQTVLTNQDIAMQLDTSHDWIFSRTGISSRHIASVDETTSSMAAIAALKAIEASDINASSLDLILVASCTPDYFFPSVACHVHKALNLSRTIPAFDISAACSGFIYAMDVAKHYINSGAANNVLVIGSETMSRAVDWKDRATCVLFGDGAGAVVLSGCDDVKLFTTSLHANPHQDDLLSYPNYTSKLDNSVINMRGAEVFKLAVNNMNEVLDEVLHASSLQKSDIDWLIPHQANIRIIQSLAKKLNLPMSKVIVTLENQGNTSAASIPLALDFSIRSKRIQRGEVLLLESFGGGMTWGAIVVRY